MLFRSHREGLDGTCDGNEAWHTAKRRKRPCVRPATFETGSCSSGGVWRAAKRRKRTSYGQNGVLLIGRGVAYRKMEETDLCWSATVEIGVLLIGRGVVYRKTEETDFSWTSYGLKRGPVDREGCGVPQNGGNGLVLERLRSKRGPIHPPSTASL